MCSQTNYGATLPVIDMLRFVFTHFLLSVTYCKSHPLNMPTPYIGNNKKITVHLMGDNNNADGVYSSPCKEECMHVYHTYGGANCLFLHTH